MSRHEKEIEAREIVELLKANGFARLIEAMEDVENWTSPYTLNKPQIPRINKTALAKTLGLRAGITQNSVEAYLYEAKEFLLNRGIDFASDWKPKEKQQRNKEEPKGYYRSGRRWLAKISCGYGNQKILGYFDTPEEARAAFLKAKAEKDAIQQTVLTVPSQEKVDNDTSCQNTLAVQVEGQKESMAEVDCSNQNAAIPRESLSTSKPD